MSLVVFKCRGTRGVIGYKGRTDLHTAGTVDLAVHVMIACSSAC